MGQRRDWRPVYRGILILLGIFLMVFGFGNGSGVIMALTGVTGILFVVGSIGDMMSTVMSEAFEKGSTINIDYAL